VPVIPRTRKHDLDLASQELTRELLQSADCVLIATAHSDYDWETICTEAQLVVDTRNACQNVTSAKGKVWKA